MRGTAFALSPQTKENRPRIVKERFTTGQAFPKKLHAKGRGSRGATEKKGG